MKVRVTEIMVGNHRKGLSRWGRLVLVVVAAACLPLLPALGDGDKASEAETALADTDDTPTFQLYDGFDGRLELDRRVVRSDSSHVSLTKNPGKLTVTSQCGSLFESETRLGSGVRQRRWM